MNQTLHDMHTRRSVRRFKDRPVEKELLDQVLQAGLEAASGRNYQDSRILVINNPALRQEIIKANAEIGGWEEGFDPFYGAPQILAVVGDSEIPTWQYNGTLVLGNMMLAAHALGLGSCWIHRAKEEFERLEFKKVLREAGLPESAAGVGFLALGYPQQAAVPEIPRKENRIIVLD